MKPSSARASDLQRFLDLSLTAETISERLHPYLATMPAQTLREILERWNFDVAAIDEPGSTRIHRYVLLGDLNRETCGECARPIPLDGTVARATPLLDCLRPIIEHGRIFVLGRSGVEEIITRADLEKQPVRLLLFGIVSSLEMALLDLLRKRFPDGEWTQYLKEPRLSKAQEILDGRTARNEELDLADCLQICDKVRVLLTDPVVVRSWGFSSKGQAKTFFDRIQRLRDKLAHAQSPASGSRWADVVSLVEYAERVLEVTYAMIENGEFMSPYEDLIVEKVEDC